METSQLGKWFIFIGLGIILLGVLFLIGNKIDLNFGKLPGDIQVHKEKFSVHFPLLESCDLAHEKVIFLSL